MNLDKLKEKFFRLFEKPDASQEYDTHEGGFFNSKLVDTEDAVACVFSNLDEQKMSELIECLNSISAKWVKKEA